MMKRTLTLYRAYIRPIYAAIILFAVALFILWCPPDYMGSIVRALYSPLCAVAVYIPAFLLWEFQYCREQQNNLTIFRMSPNRRIISSVFTTSVSSFLFTAWITALIAARLLLNGRRLVWENLYMMILMWCCFQAVSLLFKSIYLLSNKLFLSFTIVECIVFCEYLSVMFSLKIKFYILMAPAFMTLSFG